MPENPRCSISAAISRARARLPGTAARDTAGIGIGRSSWVDWAVRLGVWHLAAVQIRKVGVIAALGAGGWPRAAAPATTPSRRRLVAATSTSSTARRSTAPTRLEPRHGRVRPSTAAITNVRGRARLRRAGAVSRWESSSSPVATVPITVFYPGLDGSEEGQPPGHLRPPGRGCRPARPRRSASLAEVHDVGVRGPRLPPTPTAARIHWCSSATASRATGCSPRSSPRISRHGDSSSRRSNIPTATSRPCSATSARRSPG